MRPLFMIEGGEAGTLPGVLRFLETRAPETATPDPLDLAADVLRVEICPVPREAELVRL